MNGDGGGTTFDALAKSASPSYNERMNRLPPFATASLLLLARRFMQDEPSRVFGFDTVYLRRWWLVRDDDGGNVYLHQMMRSDADPEYHDHEFDGSMTILLEGEMHEYTPEGMRTIVAGDMVVRGALDRHRIEIDAPTISLFVTGPRDTAREWGFWDALGKFTASREMFATRYAEHDWYGKKREDD